MGKADRTRDESARARIAAQQAAARRGDARRRMVLAAGSVVGVIVIVVGIVIAMNVNKHTAKAPAAGAASTAVPAVTAATVAKDVASVPASALNSVGAGPSGADQVTPLTKISGAPLTVDGKPDVLFIGAEYCPYCAAERWAMTVALSRFGTFSGLGLIHSSSTDVFSNTATLDFYKASYSSNYLAFSSVELQTVTGAALQQPTPAQQQLLATYDAPPYVSSSDSGAIPFIDFGGKFLLSGSQYLPSVLGSDPNPDASHFGLTWLQIATALHDPSSPVAQSVLGAANTITASLCTLTGGQPGSVCGSPAVQSIG